MSLLTNRTRRNRGVLVAALVALVLIVAACGGGSGGASNAAKETSTSAAHSATSVFIDTFMFSPKTLHVKVGDTVTWTNKDNILHTVTSGTREYEPGDSGHVTATHKDGMFDMQLDGESATGKFTFTKAGTFHYFCNRHPGMEADIDVS
jgi:plastocyanin